MVLSLYFLTRLLEALLYESTVNELIWKIVNVAYRPIHACNISESIAYKLKALITS